MLLPASWTGWLLNFIQPLIPFQRGIRSAEQSVVDAFSHESGPVDREQFDIVSRERTALEHTAAGLSARVTELENEVSTLMATRSRRVEGRAIGMQGQLLPAQVVGEDPVWWRTSRLVDVGRSHGAKRGVAVISSHFTVDAGEAEGTQKGMTILLGEALIGWVEEAATHTSLVRLTSDAGTKVKVKIGRMEETGFVLIDRYFWLTGRGEGMMEIHDVERRDVEERVVRSGDLVLSDPFSPLLPTGLTIGRITSMTIDRGNPLFAILTVESEVPLDELRRVYVYDPAPAVAE